MFRHVIFCVAFLPVLILLRSGCPTDEAKQLQTVAKLDSALLIQHLRILSAADMQGRETGTAGNKKAQDYILKQLRSLDSQTEPFPFEEGKGLNIRASIKGSRYPDSIIAISAHYDHVGVQNGKIFYGADDNASGTAALLAMANYFSKHPPQHSLLFIAFDAEEKGLLGSKYFVGDSLQPVKNITVNVNMDMISRNDKNEIYAVGTSQYPFLKKYVDSVASKTSVNILFGHDDWISQSDHYSFHQKQIPFLYFGVEDHADYHRPTDTYDKINKQFYYRVSEAVTDLVILLDEQPAFSR